MCNLNLKFTLQNHKMIKDVSFINLILKLNRTNTYLYYYLLYTIIYFILIYAINN